MNAIDYAGCVQAVPSSMTPTGGVPSWKHEDLEKVKELCLATCRDSHGRDKDKIADLVSEIRWLREHYVSRQEFEDYQELVTTRYARVVKVVDGVVWAIIAAMVGAVVALTMPGLRGH